LSLSNYTNAQGERGTFVEWDTCSLQLARDGTVPRAEKLPPESNIDLPSIVMMDFDDDGGSRSMYICPYICAPSRMSHKHRPSNQNSISKIPDVEPGGGPRNNERMRRPLENFVTQIRGKIELDRTAPAMPP